MFFKLVFLKVLKTSQESTWKVEGLKACNFKATLQGLETWRPATLIKKDYKKGAFLWGLQNFQKHLFLRNTSGGCFCIVLKE